MNGDTKTYSGQKLVLYFGVGVVLFFLLMYFGTIVVAEWMQPYLKKRGQPAKTSAPARAPEASRQ